VAISKVDEWRLMPKPKWHYLHLCRSALKSAVVKDAVDEKLPFNLLQYKTENLNY
jgi:hypothetical protein